MIAELDERANPILCLQETQLQHICLPQGVAIEHNALEGKAAGGYLTIYPVSTHMLQMVKKQFLPYLQMAL